MSTTVKGNRVKVLTLAPFYAGEIVWFSNTPPKPKTHPQPVNPTVKADVQLAMCDICMA